jgi:hypothetical protein
MATLLIVKKALLDMKDRTGSSLIAINKWIETNEKVRGGASVVALFCFGLARFYFQSTKPNFKNRTLFVFPSEMVKSISLDPSRIGSSFYYQLEDNFRGNMIRKSWTLWLISVIAMGGNTFTRRLRNFTYDPVGDSEGIDF